MAVFQDNSLMNFKISLMVGSKEFNNIALGMNVISSDIMVYSKRLSHDIARDLSRSLKTYFDRLRVKNSKKWSSYAQSKLSTSLLSRTGESWVRAEKSIKIEIGEDNISASFELDGKIGLHSYAKTLAPKRANYLTIPLDAALTSNGMPLRKRARDWDNTFVRLSQKNNLIIFRRELNGGITPLYLLQKRVKQRDKINIKQDQFLNTPEFKTLLSDVNKTVKSIFREFNGELS